MKNAIFAITAFLMTALPANSFAAKGDIALSQDYQLQSEKDIFKDKFSWGIDFTYGLSSASRLLGLGTDNFSEEPSREYLDTLGMSYSTSDFSLALGASYLLTHKLELSAGVPLSIVMAKIDSGGRGGKHPQLKLAVGDIYAGVSYALLTESKNMPLVISSFEAKTALSKYTSMGDGFWGLTPGAYLRKFISTQAYIMGLAGYTFRLDRRGTRPRGNTKYGAGLGILSENRRLEVLLERSLSGKTTLNGQTIMDSEEDLTLGVNFTTILGQQTTSIGLFLSGLEQGLNWGKNSAGLYIGFTF